MHICSTFKTTLTDACKSWRSSCQPFFLSSCSKVQPPAPQKPPFPIVTTDNLFAVDCFDRQHVWVVGFNSVIAATSDGGKTWEFQKSGVENNLCAVSFVTPAVGWISGRAGTMLHTSDSSEAPG